MDEELPEHVAWYAFLRAANISELFMNSDKWSENDRYKAISAILHFKLRSLSSSEDGVQPEPNNRQLDRVSIKILEY